MVFKWNPEDILFLKSEDPTSLTAPAEDPSGPRIGLYLLQGCNGEVVPGIKCMNGSVQNYEEPFNNDELPGPNDGCLQFIFLNPASVEEFRQLFLYQSGYLTLLPGKAQKGLEFLSKHLDHIALNVQRGAVAGKTGQTEHKVINPGLALGQCDFYGPNSTDPRSDDDTPYLMKITRLLLTAQYKAVANFAIQEALKDRAKRIPVVFPMIGGGGFPKDKLAIAQSVSAAIAVLKKSGRTNIDFCLSMLNPAEIAEYKTLVADDPDCKDIQDILNQPPIDRLVLNTLTTLAQGPILLAMEEVISALNVEVITGVSQNTKIHKLNGLKNKYLSQSGNNSDEVELLLLRFIAEAGTAGNLFGKHNATASVILLAMDKAIAAVSANGIMSFSQNSKKKKLENHKKNYLAQLLDKNPFNAKMSLNSFIAEAGTARNLFGKHHETASVKAFWGALDIDTKNTVKAAVSPSVKSSDTPPPASPEQGSQLCEDDLRRILLEAKKAINEHRLRVDQDNSAKKTP